MDEIGEMTAALQAKLLHVLQDAEFTKLGSNKRVAVDVRVVAATNRDLEAMMLRGDFREDLYYRLKVIEIVVPPLRERRDEILPLAEFFLARYSRRYNRPFRPLSDRLLQRFREYEWPGNVRELENMIKRAVVLQDETLVFQDLARSPRTLAPMPPAHPSLRAALRATPGAAQPQYVSVPVRAGPRRRTSSASRAHGTRSPLAASAEAGSRRPRGAGAGCQRLAGGGGQARGAAGRACRHRGDAAPRALEPAQGGAAARRELQDAAQQDQGVRDQPAMKFHF
jgi:DNA-binding NtrC family response regulator